MGKRSLAGLLEVSTTLSVHEKIILIVRRASPLLPLCLQLQEDPVHRVDLGVQGGPGLPLVQSHQLVPINVRKYECCL